MTLEHVWDYIREQKGFNNHTFATIEQVENHLEQAVKEIANENNKMKSLCNFYWINYLVQPQKVFNALGSVDLVV